jgi:hypothetical protein
MGQKAGTELGKKLQRRSQIRSDPSKLSQSEEALSVCQTGHKIDMAGSMPVQKWASLSPSGLTV